MVVSCGLALLVGLSGPPAAVGQVDRDTDWFPTCGNRPIDKLPKSQYAYPESYRSWGEPAAPARHELAST